MAIATTGAEILEKVDHPMTVVLMSYLAPYVFANARLLR
jgi:hypothetical protein